MATTEILLHFGEDRKIMKKCPTCEKTYDDALRFCQADGTPLVAAEEPLDPYKTMVARPGDFTPPLSPPSSEPGVPDARDKGEVLEIPAQKVDPKKTMYASEEEIRRAISEAESAENAVMDLPPLVEPKPPEFIEPALPKADAEPSRTSPADIPTTPPIPSPFSTPSTEQEPFEPPTPEPPAFVASDVKTTSAPVSPNPFDTPFAGPSAPAAIEPVSVSPQIEIAQPEVRMQNPTPSAATGQNKTLPIVSLASAILSLCCLIAPITGLIAVITGFLGMRNANNDPANYGGKGLAITGLILGVIFFLAGIGYWIFVIFFGGMNMLLQLSTMTK